jgi:alginate O-acetyltransferase complex protein AlgI
MVFSSISFLFYFLPVFFLCYFALGRGNWVIIAGSAIFYVWGEGANILLITGLLLINYALGRLVRRADIGSTALLIGISINLAALIHYKYAQFLADNLTNIGFGLAARYPVDSEHHLPLGISFFVFQNISYLVDVHFGRVEVEKRLSHLATCVLMFPHLIAGPIVRYANIAGEIAARQVSWMTIGLGIQYFIVGLAQKVLVANTVARFSDHAFSIRSGDLDALTAWLGAIAYTIQIYFDFCGYSNMAIGLALAMGFHFPRNFNYPYSAQSIADFWRRWHISLSTWFRDYVYIALGGNRVGRLAMLRNLLIVFLLTGFWHGAAWTFILWGLFHGLFLLIEREGLGRRLLDMPIILRQLYTMTVVIFGWILFRATSLDQCVSFWKAMVFLSYPAPDPLKPVPLTLWLTPEVCLALIAGVILSQPSLPKFLDRLGMARIGRQPNIADPALDIHYVHALPVLVLLIGLCASIALLTGDSLNPFLYFRF